jgi:toxin ParE1/3/4
LVIARDWYDRRKLGLGDQFSTRALAVFDQIAEMPALFGLVWEDIWACRIRKFPYVVYYRVLAEHVEVLAILHGGRGPSAWQSRV